MVRHNIGESGHSYILGLGEPQNLSLQRPQTTVPPTLCTLKLGGCKETGEEVFIKHCEGVCTKDVQRELDETAKFPKHDSLEGPPICFTEPVALANGHERCIFIVSKFLNGPLHPLLCLAASQFHVSPNYLILVFLCVTGGQLFDRVANASSKFASEFYSERELRQWFLPVIDALRVLHAAGLQHRDLKPQVCDD